MSAIHRYLLVGLANDRKNMSRKTTNIKPILMLTPRRLSGKSSLNWRVSGYTENMVIRAIAKTIEKTEKIFSKVFMVENRRGVEGFWPDAKG